MLILDYIKANWQLKNNVFALSTTTIGGISKPPYDTNNLATHVGDNELDVQDNRKQLIEQLNLPSTPQWLEQTHSNHCVVIETDSNRIADASVTRKPNIVLAILTADCLPIVITNKQGSEIAAIHAGWRGLANGIIENTIAKIQSPSDHLIAWIGPSICFHCYETGEEVLTAFTSQYPFTQTAFQFQENKLHANLPELAEMILKNHGISAVYQSKQCSYETKIENNVKNKYYSYRRQKQTGRIATLIWFK